MADEFADTIFPAWLESVPEDFRQMAAVIDRGDVPDALRKPLIGALNYAFKQLDMIPDWVESLGYIDDAIVLRIGAALASEVDAGEADGDDLQHIWKLGNEVDLVTELLGDGMYSRMQRYVEALPATAVRGRTAETVLSNGDQRQDFLREVEDFASGYEMPAYEPSDKHPEKVRWIIKDKLGG